MKLQLKIEQPEVVSVGCDPELFLKERRLGEYQSCIGLFGGTKNQPRQLGNRYGFGVQEDNVALEFNIPPANSYTEWLDSIEYALIKLEEEANGYDYDLAIDPIAIFNPDELQHPLAQVFGCDPDVNAWTGEINHRPIMKNPNMRSAGGHIHVGSKPLSTIDVIKAMDLFLGVPSILMDKDRQRRKLYGKAGACRLKPYGGEYRVLSNFWLQNENYRAWVYTQTQRACAWVRGGGVISEGLGHNIQSTINSSNEEMAQMIIAENQLVVV